MTQEEARRTSLLSQAASNFVAAAAEARGDDLKTWMHLSDAMHRWGRYAKFLRIILARYLELRREYVELMRRKMNPAMTKIGEAEYSALATAVMEGELRLHLEIETFYTNAKILLDRIADTFLWFFGQTPVKYGSSHTKLAIHPKTGQRRFEEVCGARGLTVQPPTLPAIMEEVSSLVIAFRDVMEHKADAGVQYATVLEGTGAVKILVTRMLFEGDVPEVPHQTGLPEEILPRVEQYAVDMIGMMRSNSARSIIGVPLPNA